MSNDTRVTLDRSVYNDLCHHSGGRVGVGALASRCVKIGLAALLADVSLERQPRLLGPVGVKTESPGPPPAIPRVYDAFIAKLGITPVEGTAAEIGALGGFETSPNGVCHSLRCAQKHGLVTFERVGYKSDPKHHAPVAVWRVTKTANGTTSHGGNGAAR